MTTIWAHTIVKNEERFIWYSVMSVINHVDKILIWDTGSTKTIEKHGNEIESIVVPTYNLVEDIYHYQEEAAGRYNLAGRRGHLSLRAVNTKIPGLHSEKPHGTWGWVDGQGRMIQDRDPRKIKFCKAPYLHATHLPRASERAAEEFVPKGIPFPPDFYYPEVFFRPRPKTVPSPWVKKGKSGY